MTWKSTFTIMVSRSAILKAWHVNLEVQHEPWVLKIFCQPRTAIDSFDFLCWNYPIICLTITTARHTFCPWHLFLIYWHSNRTTGVCIFTKAMSVYFLMPSDHPEVWMTMNVWWICILSSVYSCLPLIDPTKNSHVILKINECFMLCLLWDHKLHVFANVNLTRIAHR